MKDASKAKRIQRMKRAARTRAKIFGTQKRPRLAVFISNKHIYAQLINDEKGNTLTSASDLELKEKAPKTKKAVLVGQLIAKKANEQDVKEAIFSKGGYKYHGALKAVAEGAREGGLKF